MSATAHGAGDGVVLGIVVPLLLQQFGDLDLTSLTTAIEYIVIGAVVGGVIGAVIGWGMGKLYQSRHSQPTPMKPYENP